LYSATFAAAVTVLRWICLGVMLQVITWPMGYIIVAKGRPAIFFAAEMGWTLVAIALSWWCVTRFGLNGAGFAFFGSYVFHCVLLYPMVRWLSGFKWSRENRNKGATFFCVIGVVFAGFQTLPFWLAEIIGVVFAIASGIYSIRVLLQLVSSDRLPPATRRILRLLGLIASDDNLAHADLTSVGGPIQ
jgi:enterobacterial common antigen flippase